MTKREVTKLACIKTSVVSKIPWAEVPVLVRVQPGLQI